MNFFKIGVVLLFLLLVTVTLSPIVAAQEETIDDVTNEENNVVAIDVSSILLPPLHFDNSQEKVIVNDELSPIEGIKLISMLKTATGFQELKNSKIPLGSIIHHSVDGVTTVFDSNGTQLFAAEDNKAKLIWTPSGLKSATYVHEVPTRSLIYSQNDKTFVVNNKQVVLIEINEQNQNRKSLESELNSVWPIQYIEGIEYSPIENIGKFTTKWTVPIEPSSSKIGTIIALWNGIHRTTLYDGVIQPVVTWNEDGDQRYTARVWQVSDVGGIYKSAQIGTRQGHQIRGTITWDKELGYWKAVIRDLDTNDISTIYSNVVPNTNCQIAIMLEGWGIDYKSELPGDTTFSNIALKSERGRDITPSVSSVTATVSEFWRTYKPQVSAELDVYTNNWPDSVIFKTGNSESITFIITPIAGSHGTITPTEPQMVPAGGSQIFTISPDQGYVVEDVKINKESIGAVTSYTFKNVDKDSTIRVTFKRQPIYTITPNAGSHGTISPSTPQNVLAGGSQTFTISANTGYVISDVFVDGASVGAVNSYTFENVQANHRIRATFKPSPSTFTIIASAGSGGSISPSGSVTAPAGGSQTFTIASNSGYMIADVFVDGISQGAISTYTFNNVQADHTISASFKPASVPGPDWIWSRDGWGDWEHTATWSGGSGSEYGPVMVGDHGEHGTDVNLGAGSTESSVWRTFTDPSGSGWNTITFEGLMSGSDVPGGRWMTIDVNGQQVFGGTASETPPGNHQIFEITETFPQSPTVTVKISNGQNPAWGPRFSMEFHSLKLTQGTALRMTDKESPFVIPDGSGLVTNGTASQ